MMKNRISYYVSRKNVLVWLAALVMVCSAIARIAYFCGKGADAATVWFQIVLPVAASLIYVLILLCSGEERLYRTAVPVFMAAIYFGIRISSMDGMWRRYILLCWIAYMAFAVAYAVIISGKAATFKQHPLFCLIFTIFAIYAYAAIDFCCDWMYYTIK